MKTNAILTLLVAGAMSFTACTTKVDEKTLTEINQFGTEWTALGEKASNWSNELNQTTDKAKEFAAQQTQIANNMAGSKDEATKTKIHEMAAKATEDEGRFTAMQNEWNTFKVTWDEETKKYSEWKDKVIKGEVAPEETSKGIAEFKTKMSDAQARIEGWNAAYTEAKTSCEQNMAMAESVNKTAEAAKK
jgi:hypothetical protein